MQIRIFAFQQKRNVFPAAAQDETPKEQVRKEAGPSMCVIPGSTPTPTQSVATSVPAVPNAHTFAFACLVCIFTGPPDAASRKPTLTTAGALRQAFGNRVDGNFLASRQPYTRQLALSISGAL